MNNFINDDNLHQLQSLKEEVDRGETVTKTYNLNGEQLTIEIDYLTPEESSTYQYSLKLYRDDVLVYVDKASEFFTLCNSFNIALNEFFEFNINISSFE